MADAVGPLLQPAALAQRIQTILQCFSLLPHGLQGLCVVHSLPCNRLMDAAAAALALPTALWPSRTSHQLVTLHLT